MRHLLTLLGLVLALALAACGGSGDDGSGDGDQAGPSPTEAATATATPPPVKTKPLAASQVDKIKLKTAKAKLIKDLGADPVLVQGPTSAHPGGCVFYPIQNQPLANVWLFCFDDDERLNVLATQYSSSQPDPPKDASQARAALIARGDIDCNSQNGFLGSITKDVTKALRALGEKESKANTQALAKQVTRFVANIDETHELLAAYEPPPDAAEALDAYLQALDEQTSVLRDARDALVDGDMATYDELGSRFSELGETAKQSARAYGFATCSASTFS